MYFARRRCVWTEKSRRSGTPVHGSGARRGLKNARIQLALTVLQHNLRVLARPDRTAKKGETDSSSLRQIA